MFYPKLEPQTQLRLFTETFGGYNHNLKIASGEWYDEENLSSSSYPLFAQRERRGVVGTLQNPQGMLAKDALLYVDGAQLFYNGVPVPGIALSTDADMCPKKLVSMGAYAVIFPDKVYVNTKDLTDSGPLDAAFSSIEDAAVTYRMCRVDGEDYDLTNAIVSPSQPGEPENGDYWIDTSGEKHALKQYSSTTALWTAIPTVYVKIGCPGIGASFAAYDGVALSGCAGPGENPKLAEQIAALNAPNVVYQKGDDYIVVVGLVDQAYIQRAGSVTVKRQSPALDFVTECENRLWGCRYGMKDGKMVNEIYACKLGDFRNWNCFMGVSTDSYAATVGTDGRFTGAITHLGYPLFFKENCLHKVHGSYPANYQIQTTACRGVQEGSEGSLAIAMETLFYKSREDVCAYDGSLPASVSQQLGQAAYGSAVGGAYGAKYYISMRDEAGAWHLFVYDAARAVWHREDATHALAFANVRGDFLYIDAGTGALVSVSGRGGTPEGEIPWSATSGILGYELPDAKYVSRFNIRAKLAAAATLRLEIEYDSDGEWTFAGAYAGAGAARTFTIPVVPRRCDHLRLRLSGVGDAKIFSIARILEQGGDGYVAAF